METQSEEPKKLLGVSSLIAAVVLITTALTTGFFEKVGESVSSKVIDRTTLNIEPSWPTLIDCDGATSVAMPSSGSNPTDFSPRNGDVRTDVIEKGGSALGTGMLTLLISANGDGAVHIKNIKPIAAYDKSQASWSYAPAGGCGDTNYREYNLNLNRQVPVLAMQRDSDNEAETESSGTHSRKNQSSTFVVQSMDPEEVLIVASYTKKGRASFRLEVEYSIDGNENMKQIVDNNGKPFSIFGTIPSKQYTSEAENPHLVLADSAGLPIQESNEGNAGNTQPDHNRATKTTLPSGTYSGVVTHTPSANSDSIRNYPAKITVKDRTATIEYPNQQCKLRLVHVAGEDSVTRYSEHAESGSCDDLGEWEFLFHSQSQFSGSYTPQHGRYASKATFERVD